jgi:hypothetical protein
MRLTALSKMEWAIIGVILAIVVALIVPVQEAVWDGHFPLTLDLRLHQSVNDESLMLSIFWSEADARESLVRRSHHDHVFHPVETLDGSHAEISVPAFGRLSTWGAGTYHHPRFLVIEYRVDEGDNPTVARKLFSIPEGRGARSITVELP